jgi:colanic acid/amylovoran biosynthesis glycosyltransferase
MPKSKTIAYLTTVYPKVSHTFIRREILELERRGMRVLRASIRSDLDTLVDPADQAEAKKTTVVLSQPPWRLVAATLVCMLTTPTLFCRALLVSLETYRASSRSWVRHAAYFVEACYLRGLFAREGVEHVHVHFGTNCADVARLLHVLGGPSYSMTVHGPDELDAPAALSLGAKIADSAFTVAISDYCSAQLRRWVDRSHWEKIKIVHCALGSDFLDATTVPVADSRTFLCVARLSAQKGQLLILDALAKLLADGYEARLVLGGDGELRGAVEERIAELGLERNVTITGWIDSASVRELLGECRAFLLPSFAEGLPVVIMEAMALGRPVISTYIAGIPELLRDGETGWIVPSGNADEIVRVMKLALDASPADLAKMGQAARDRVRLRHDIRTEVSKLHALFDIECTE